jgi:8-amino-7-oxononanoate synthase
MRQSDNLSYAQPNVQTKERTLLNKFALPTKGEVFENAVGLYPYFKPIQQSEGPEVMMEGRSIIMAGSNNYLGLASHPKVKEAAIKAVEKYGTSCSGSRFLTGTLDLHLELEAKLAQFMGKEACLLFSTGYQTSQGVIQSLVSRGDYIFSDRDNHASIVIGNLIAKAAMNVSVCRYRHNDLRDLEAQLAKAPLEAGKLIVTDGVFSTSGAVAQLDEMYAIADRYNAVIAVDDAHAFGVIGEGGRGTASHFGLSNEIELTFCTFSKTLASIGGFVVGDRAIIEHLRCDSPALMFSASPTPASTASAMAALEVLEKEPYRVGMLQAKSHAVRNELQAMGYELLHGETSIISVKLPDEQIGAAMWQALFDAGVFVNLFLPPAVPKGAMLRTSIMCTHQESHLQKIVDTYKHVGKQLGVI